MIARHRLLGAACAAFLAALTLLGGCGPKPTGDDHNPPTYKYRLTATVDTPQGNRSGHSVIAVWWRGANPAFGSQGSAGFTIRGEAVAVDLPNGQTLFVLLRAPSLGGDWAAYAHEMIPTPPGVGSSRADYFAVIAADGDVHPVKPRRNTVVSELDNYPTMVRFRDIRDPTSVEQVDPADLAKSFGPGYRLASLTVQVTDEPVTMGIRKRLGWLEEYRKNNARLNGSTSAAISTNDLSDNLGTGAFSTGFEK